MATHREIAAGDGQTQPAGQLDRLGAQAALFGDRSGFSEVLRQPGRAPGRSVPAPGTQVNERVTRALAQRSGSSRLLMRAPASAFASRAGQDRAKAQPGRLGRPSLQRRHRVPIEVRADLVRDAEPQPVLKDFGQQAGGEKP